LKIPYNNCTVPKEISNWKEPQVNPKGNILNNDSKQPSQDVSASPKVLKQPLKNNLFYNIQRLHHTILLKSFKGSEKKKPKSLKGIKEEIA
jgi:hypothetical protein